jgi:hypothetical protein
VFLAYGVDPTELAALSVWKTGYDDARFAAGGSECESHGALRLAR